MSKLSVNELTDETGSGAPSFPNGVSVTGAALTDPEITGGIYLGGTGSANYLEDYETGTWTPQLGIDGDTDGFNYNQLDGFYVKVGRNVTLHGCASTTSIGSSSGNFTVNNIPFPVSAVMPSTGDQANGTTTVFIVDNDSVSDILVNAQSGTSFLRIRHIPSGGGTHTDLTTASVNSDLSIRFTISYTTDD